MTFAAVIYLMTLPLVTVMTWGERRGTAMQIALLWLLEVLAGMSLAIGRLA